MLQQQQGSATPPPGGAGGQGGLAGPNPPWWRQGRGLIVLSAAISAITTLLLILLVGGVFVAVQTHKPATAYQFQKVTQANFALTVGMAGPLQGGIYNVVFSGTGKIAEIDVKVGQTVTEGQVLAKLDKTSLRDAVNQAQKAVRIAQTAMNNGQAISNSTFGLSGSNINAAQTGLKNAQANLKKVQAQSTASVDTAQTTLDNAQANLQAAEVQAEANISAAHDQVTQACATPPPSPTLVSCTTAQDEYNQAVAAANAGVTVAQTQVNSAQSQVNATSKQVSSNDTTAQNQVNAAQGQVNTAMSSAGLSDTSAQAQISVAQSQLDAAIAQLQTAEHNLGNATLTAPHYGVVTVINGTVGGTPGVTVNTLTSPAAIPGTIPFIGIEDTSALQIQANVDESDAANVRVGEPAQFTVAAYGNRMFRGTVSAISPNGATISNVVTFPVTVDVDMTSLQGATLLPGMTASVTIDVTQRSNVLLIPVGAVNFAQAAASISSATPRLISQQQATSALGKANQMLQQLLSENPQTSMDNPVPAFVLEQSNGQFVVKPVVLGLTDGTNYEVLSGLSPGETILVGVQRGG